MYLSISPSIYIYIYIHTYILCRVLVRFTGFMKQFYGVRGPLIKDTASESNLHHIAVNRAKCLDLRVSCHVQHTWFYGRNLRRLCRQILVLHPVIHQL